ncbi:MAG: DNA primase [Candidatus Nomurabacteria bacterium]|jgi:DNA primase|nr:DNA primase [Candidatus Nomurabacteria bacterium]
MQDAKEEVRSRLPVEDVIGQYLELKRAGRNLKALSPFTNEKTPSFMVSPERGVWHDYSSGKGGDIFSFIMEVEGMTFREALEHLAHKAGVDLKLYNFRTDETAAKKRKKLLAVLGLAEKYYRFTLTKNPKVMEYVFYKRNLARKTVTDFRIGYAPSSGKALTDFLKKRGCSEAEITAAGLFNRFKSDLFKGRMMIPLMDSGGATIGFTGRIVDDADKNAPKYLNSPQTFVYDKSRHVFGLSQAKDAIRKSGFAVIVEGNMDVISSHQAGVCEAVATAGTAMTEEQLKTLSRWTTDLRLAYDGDAAGVRAAERAVGVASKLGINLSIIADYGAKDPDELIQKDPALWQAAVQNTQPAMEWVLAQYETTLDLSTGAGKREYSSKALELINHIVDEVEKAEYERKLAEKLKLSEDAIKHKAQTLIDQAIKPRPKKPMKIAEHAAPPPAENLVLDTILGIYLWQGGLPTAHLEGLEFAEDAKAAVARAIINGQKLDKKAGDVYTTAQVLSLRAEGRYSVLENIDFQQELESLLKEVEKNKVKQQIDELSNLIREADESDDLESVTELQKQKIALTKQLEGLNKEYHER